MAPRSPLPLWIPLLPLLVPAGAAAEPTGPVAPAVPESGADVRDAHVLDTQGQDPQEFVPVTRWPEEMGRRNLLPWDSWTWREARGPLRIRTRSAPRPAKAAAERGRVAVLVEAGLQDEIPDALETWLEDLALDGWEPLYEEVEGGTASELRTHLAELYEEGLQGAVLLGDLPIPWYEIANDFNQYGYASFPVDLFYMDLDGAWSDRDGNGLFDGHEDGDGDAAPEIWVGHFIVSPRMGDRAELLEAYFERNHAWRRGEIAPTGAGLNYVDDDWSYWAGQYGVEMSFAFPDVQSVSDRNVTSASDYLPRLEESFDNIGVFVHSSPEYHYFVKNGVYDTMSWHQVPAEADALFYNLFACSNANYAEEVYMGGVYALSTDGGLVAVGSTKTGAMLEFAHYYRPLGEYACFGEALRQWWEALYPYDFDELCWHYGMTLIGDPTLRIAYPTLEADPASIEAEADLDGLVELELEIANTGYDLASWSLSASEDWISVDPDSGEGLAADPVTVAVTLDASVLEVSPGQATLSVASPGATNQPLEIPVSLVVEGLPTDTGESRQSDSGIYDPPDEPLNASGGRCGGCGTAPGLPTGVLSLVIVGAAGGIRRRRHSASLLMDEPSPLASSGLLSPGS